MAGLSVHELAARVRVAPRRVRELMAEDAARGLVEQDRRGRWHLTPSAELLFGSTLRSLTEPSTAPRRRCIDLDAADGPQGNLDRLEAPAREPAPLPLRLRGSVTHERRRARARPAKRASSRPT